MTDEKESISRREAIKNIGLGVGAIASLPVLGGNAAAQVQATGHAHHTAQASGQPAPQPLKFFTEEENKTVIEMCERIVPADDTSAGARAARVNEYIDFVLSISPDATRQTWREGLAAINKKSRDMFGKDFAGATEQQQVELLTEISKNERAPKTPEERFFRTVKYATVDGYYTSEIGIREELKYKGNSFMKEFKGCTHPEHQ